MAKTDSITQARLKELLHYDPDSGLFKRRIGRTGSAKKGMVAGGQMICGYVSIKIDGIPCLAHRLAFLYQEGEIPIEVDHKNHIRNDNRWDNLRHATRSINQRNASRRADNTSGLTGVSWNTRKRKWIVQVADGDDRGYIGAYQTLFDAACAVKAAHRKQGFHANHGDSVVARHDKYMGVLSAA